jgi:electron transfer flavoprotein alpha subunit
MSGAVLVFVEQTAGEPDRLSLEAVALARRIASGLGAALDAVLLGTGAETAASRLGTYGVGLAHVAAEARFDDYAPAAWGAAVRGAMDTRGASAVVAAGSDRGNEVLAHLAARSGLPMAANVIEVETGGAGAAGAAGAAGGWRLVRQRWAGSLLEDSMLSAPTVSPFAPEVEPADMVARVVGREAKTSGGVSLTEAKVVVGGGRGVGSSEGFGKLEHLAEQLGGAVGGSRVVTSLGWRPHSDQIGQTGLRIAPDLYIACGISGAIQHIVGCKAAKRILAINTDPDSPIMAVADYAVIGDLGTIVPAISAEIDHRRGG